MLKPMSERDPTVWQEFAKCEIEPETMFVEGADQNTSVRKCMGCLARYACLVEVLERPGERGVWGGTTDRQRNATHKKYPNFPWRQALAKELAFQQQQRALAVRVADAEARGIALPLSATIVRVPKPPQAPAAATAETVPTQREEADVAPAAPEVESVAATA